ncbi:unnamed protein product [Euphydryas editha]|uniref:Gag-like protein n=1 Tax=Euphydryas editha TaxID=104508 RepID=A0AAU9TZY8_EUPED|nr:unnamed protein product [Euphydryas editha]
MLEEPCIEAERAIEEQVRTAEEGRRALGLDVEDPRTADALCKQFGTDLDLIYEVAIRSSYFKGTSVHALKDAAASIKSVVEDLSARSASDDVRKLQLENARLRSEMQELRLQMEELRHQRRNRAPATPSANGEDPPEEWKASMRGTMGRMLDARLAGLEEQLLPAKSLRPPLAADRIREDGQAVPASAAKKKKLAPKTEPASGPASKKMTPRTEPAPKEGPDGGEWTTVVKKTKKKKAKSYAAAAAAAPVPSKPQSLAQPKPKKARKPRLASPRSPAVLGTLDKYAEGKVVTYCHLLKRAADTIDLANLGIVGGLKLRRAATGARLLELPKGQTPEAAGRLAEAMQETLGSTARVVQPMKLASLQISGLDDSVTEAVAAAVAKVGLCDNGSIKVGAMEMDLADWDSP